MSISNPSAGGNGIEVFFSYSHNDEELRDQLSKHLAMLKREHVITAWHDRKIQPGEEWEQQIDQHLNTAEVILLLVSSDFLSSGYCYDIEVKRAMERHQAGEARVIPVILRPSDWKSAPFAKLQVLPKDSKPVTSWPNRDEAFLDIAQGIRNALQELAILHLVAKLAAAESQRNWPIVIKIGERVLALQPDNESIRGRTAIAYLNYWTSWMKGETNVYDCHRMEMRMIEMGGLRRAIELDPSNAELYYLQSEFFCRGFSSDHFGLSALSPLKEIEQVDSLKRAIELDPKNGKYWYRRSQAQDDLYRVLHKDEWEKSRREAVERGDHRVSQLAQHDFERAVELHYKEAVDEKKWPRLLRGIRIDKHE